ncbi:hypothetical protein AYO22_02068 [Fonsecaea multimorphosa]|nr:hypothetical protein AYO22_02068 [Fonsecaea multimorphosa]
MSMQPDVLVARRLQCFDLETTHAPTEYHSIGRRSLEETNTLHVETQRHPSSRQDRLERNPTQPTSHTLHEVASDSVIEGRALPSPKTNTSVQNPSGSPENGGWDLDPGLGAQLWLSILHRPKFAARYIRRTGETAVLVNRSILPDDEALLLYGIFALGARFSKSHLEEVPPVDRGEKYARHAKMIWNSIRKTLQDPSIEYLQGCVVLAAYCLTAGQTRLGSILNKHCVSHVSSLSLDEIDRELMNEDGTLNNARFEASVVSWVRKEELRRLWWSMWELDIYCATLSRQPYDIAKQIKVLLPAPDRAWFCGVPTRSAFINNHPERVWTSLQGSSNQSSRAWFLLANYLKSYIFFSSHQLPGSLTSTRSGLKTALCNFKLSLPAEFQLRSLFISNQNYEEANWVVSTHLIIIVCESLLRDSRRPPNEWNDAECPDSTQDTLHFAKRIASYLVDVGQVWPSEYIPLSHPILCCSVISLASMDIQQCECITRALEMTGLILAHYAKYWKIGSKMLQEKQTLMEIYSGLLPTTLRRESLVETSARRPGGVRSSPRQSTHAMEIRLHNDNAQWRLEVRSRLGDVMLETGSDQGDVILEVASNVVHEQVQLDVVNGNGNILISRRERVHSEADFGLGNRISLY